jgi:hypothetical protein
MLYINVLISDMLIVTNLLACLEQSKKIFKKKTKLNQY